MQFYRLVDKRLLLGIAITFTLVSSGCRKYRDDLDYSYNVQQTWSLEELQFGEVVQFESVFWEPDDTISLRKLIVDDGVASGRDVLEIGTGTGLISILCLQNDASSVVATDINPAAVSNARYNAAILCPTQTLDVRQVGKQNPGAFAVVQDAEKFDLIISNPPWEDGVIAKPADHAFYDPNFELMDSLLDGLPKHLKPGGRCLLAYGHAPALKRLREQAKKRGYEFKVLDNREIDSLDTNFLPGMLVEIRTQLSNQKVRGGAFVSGDATEEESDGTEFEENDAASEDDTAEAEDDKTEVEDNGTQAVASDAETDGDAMKTTDGAPEETDQTSDTSGDQPGEQQEVGDVNQAPNESSETGKRSSLVATVLTAFTR